MGWDSGKDGAEDLHDLQGMAEKKGEAAADGLVHWGMRLGNWIWKRGGYAVSLLISLSSACISKWNAFCFQTVFYPTNPKKHIITWTLNTKFLIPDLNLKINE